MESYCTEDYAADYAAQQIREKFDRFHLNKWMSFPTIIWKDIGKNSAGYAKFDDNSITLNTNYLYSKSWNEFLNETPLHELAHLAAYKIHHVTGHCAAWKDLCHLFGLAGNRCHSFSEPENIKVRKDRKTTEWHTVYCPCMEHKISNIRYKRMLHGEEYMCTECGHKLTINKAG